MKRILFVLVFVAFDLISNDSMSQTSLGPTQAVSLSSSTTGSSSGNILLTTGISSPHIGLIISTSATGINATIKPNAGVNNALTKFDSQLPWSGSSPTYQNYSFNVNLTGLVCNTTYYARSYAYDWEAQFGYGTQISFTTPKINVSTTAASSITTTTATSGGGVITVGCGVAAITERGIVWSTSANPTTALTTKTTNGAGTTSYSNGITGLSPNTMYYVRAYAIGDDGITYYGNQITFTTSMPAGVISPYAVTRDWAFGIKGRMLFNTGSFPNAGAPSSTALGSQSGGVEASTSLSHPDGSTAFYTNVARVYDGAGVEIRNFENGGGGDVTCAGSAAGGGLGIPNPADVNNKYYLVLSDDQTGGNCATLQGRTTYKFERTGGTGSVSYVPTFNADLADGSVSEGLAGGTDGKGRYYVAHHAITTNNTFKIWQYDSLTGITQLADQTSTPSGLPHSGSNTQSAVKFSHCQDRIAYAVANHVYVLNFDRTTGAVGTLIKDVTMTSATSGLEFSPDGNSVYSAGIGTTLYWYNLVSNTSGTVAGAGTGNWSLQLGPDGNLYTIAGQGTSTIYKVSNPNTPSSASVTSISLTAGASFYQGFINLTWLSPRKPVLNTTYTGCKTVTFNFDFKNYFGDQVTIKSSVLDLGNGSPLVINPTFPYTYDYSQGGTITSAQDYTATLSFVDMYCSQNWATTKIATTCALPVSLIDFTAINHQGVVELNWATAIEINNDRFEVQRSYDGVNFTTISTVKGAGNSNRINSYAYNDYDAKGAVVYYRLMQYDYNGSATASKVIAVNLSGLNSNAMSVFPNPFTDDFKVVKANAELATITVYDVLGRMLEQRVSPETEKSITLGEFLADGSYLVQYTSATASQTVHIEKK
jgi:hypothetical protein